MFSDQLTLELSNGVAVQYVRAPTITIGSQCWQVPQADFCTVDDMHFIRLKSGVHCQSCFARLLYASMGDTSIEKKLFGTYSSIGLQSLKNMRNECFDAMVTTDLNSSLPAGLRQHAKVKTKNLAKAKKDNVNKKKHLDLDISLQKSGTSMCIQVLKPESAQSELWVRYTPELFNFVMDYLLEQGFKDTSRNHTYHRLPKGILRFTAKNKTKTDKYRLVLSAEAREAISVRCNGLRRASLSFDSLEEAITAMENPNSCAEMYASKMSKKLKSKKRKHSAGDTDDEDDDDRDEGGDDGHDERDDDNEEEASSPGEAVEADDDGMYMMG